MIREPDSESRSVVSDIIWRMISCCMRCDGARLAITSSSGDDVTVVHRNFFGMIFSYAFVSSSLARFFSSSNHVAIVSGAMHRPLSMYSHSACFPFDVR